MRPLNVSLDDETYALAKAKPNFSAWVRDALRSERNKREEWKKESQWWFCHSCNKSSLWPVKMKKNEVWCKNRACGGYDMELIEDDSKNA